MAVEKKLEAKAPAGEPTLVSINRDMRRTEAALQARREALVLPFLKAVAEDQEVGGDEVMRRLAAAIYPLMKGAPLAGQKPKPLRPLPNQKVA